MITFPLLTLYLKGMKKPGLKLPQVSTQRGWKGSHVLKTVIEESCSPVSSSVLETGVLLCGTGEFISDVVKSSAYRKTKVLGTSIALY